MCQAIRRARELAGVEAGKEHEFRVDFVPESYGIDLKSEARPQADLYAENETQGLVKRSESSAKASHGKSKGWNVKEVHS